MSDYDWDTPDSEAFHETRRRALEILRADEAVDNLSAFYDPQRNFAGTTFDDLSTVDPHAIGPSDLLAITLMDVSVQPAAVRRLLEPGTTRDLISGALHQVRPGVTLADADTATLDAAAAFYQEVKQALRGNKWVTASKICARKRPALIPVRDRVVVAHLRLPNQDFREDWTLIRALMREPEVSEALSTLATKTPTLARSLPALRLLDTAVWMHGRAGKVSTDDEAGAE
jgi:hypothetical protein